MSPDTWFNIALKRFTACFQHRVISIILLEIFGPAHTKPEEFEDVSNDQSVHTTPEELRNSTITGNFRFVFEENSRMEIIRIVTSKIFVVKLFFVHTTKSRRFQIKRAFSKRAFTKSSIFGVSDC